MFSDSGEIWKILENPGKFWKILASVQGHGNQHRKRILMPIGGKRQCVGNQQTSELPKTCRDRAEPLRTPSILQGWQLMAV